MKRLAYEATEDVEQALADHGAYGFRSRNAMINEAVRQLVARRTKGVQECTELYRTLIEDMDAVASGGDDLAEALADTLRKALEYRTTPLVKPTVKSEAVDCTPSQAQNDTTLQQPRKDIF